MDLHLVAPCCRAAPNPELSNDRSRRIAGHKPKAFREHNQLQLRREKLQPEQVRAIYSFTNPHYS